MKAVADQFAETLAAAACAAYGRRLPPTWGQG
jgi:hypothetical protein